MLSRARSGRVSPPRTHFFGLAAADIAANLLPHLLENPKTGDVIEETALFGQILASPSDEIAMAFIDAFRSSDEQWPHQEFIDAAGDREGGDVV